MVTKWLGDQGVFPKVVIESVSSLDYYLSYDYCLHPFPPSKQANPPHIEANNT